MRPIAAYFIVSIVSLLAFTACATPAYAGVTVQIPYFSMPTTCVVPFGYMGPCAAFDALVFSLNESTYFQSDNERFTLGYPDSVTCSICGNMLMLPDYHQDSQYTVAYGRSYLYQDFLV